MSDYFDYVAEAGMWLRNYEQNDPIGAAQAHATLALAEQQRIANLIAVVTAKYPNGQGAFSSLADAAATEVLATLGVSLGVEPYTVTTL